MTLSTACRSTINISTIDIVTSQAFPDCYDFAESAIVIAPFLNQPNAGFKRRQNSGDLSRIVGLASCSDLADPKLYVGQDWDRLAPSINRILHSKTSGRSPGIEKEAQVSGWVILAR